MADERDEWVDGGSSIGESQEMKDYYLLRDFDRGFVQMNCNQREAGCGYALPHYHCQICGEQVNSDEKRRDYNPCCSLACIKAYNQ